MEIRGYKGFLSTPQGTIEAIFHHSCFNYTTSFYEYYKACNEIISSIYQFNIFGKYIFCKVFLPDSFDDLQENNSDNNQFIITDIDLIMSKVILDDDHYYVARDFGGTFPDTIQDKTEEILKNKMYIWDHIMDLDTKKVWTNGYGKSPNFLKVEGDKFL